MATTFAILHGLIAVALLGAITHQTLAVWAPSGVPPRSFFGQFRAVPSAAFANAIIILYLVTALLQQHRVHKRCCSLCAAPHPGSTLAMCCRKYAFGL
jgi:hypothetical protein